MIGQNLCISELVSPDPGVQEDDRESFVALGVEAWTNHKIPRIPDRGLVQRSVESDGNTELREEEMWGRVDDIDIHFLEC